MKKEDDDDQITKQIPGSAARSTPPVGKYKKVLRTEFTIELETSHGKQQPSKGIMCKERV